MGLRFRGSWSLVPGIRLNLGLKSGSASFGTRGLHYTVGTSGSRITAGIPGTGLFWTEKLRSQSVAVPPQQRTQNQLTSAATAQPAQAQQPRTVTPLTGAGAQFPAPQPQSFSPIIGARQPPQLRQPRQGTAGQYTATQKPMQPSGYSVSPTHSHHLVIPAWLVWAIVAVIVIGGLCFLSAMVSNLLMTRS
jgi:Protein of unknown function (DUF4236)